VADNPAKSNACVASTNKDLIGLPEDELEKCRIWFLPIEAHCGHGRARADFC
jgi:hypothetical protein